MPGLHIDTHIDAQRVYCGTNDGRARDALVERIARRPSGEREDVVATSGGVSDGGGSGGAWIGSALQSGHLASPRTTLVPVAGGRYVPILQYCCMHHSMFYNYYTSRTPMLSSLRTHHGISDSVPRVAFRLHILTSKVECTNHEPPLEPGTTMDERWFGSSAVGPSRVLNIYERVVRTAMA